MDKKILMVEDDLDIVDFMKEGLEAEGFTVENVKTVEDALMILNNTKVDLIILDLILSGESGYALCKTLRSERRYQNIPIIVVTVRSTQKAKETARSLGVSDYMTKPFKMSDLVTTVNRHLSN